MDTKHWQTNFPWKLLLLACFLAIQNIGFCDNTIGDELEKQITTVESLLFGKSIRLVVMLFGMTWGLLKTYMSQSFTPLFFYGGVGFIFFFLPKVIHLVSSLG